MIYSPLEQFTLVSLLKFQAFNFNLFFTNSTFFMLFGIGLFFFLLTISIYKSKLVPGYWQSFTEMLYEFVLSLVVEQIGVKSQKYFHFIFVLFVFILSCNMIGMIPYSFTATSQIIVTFGLAFSVFVGINIIAFTEHGLHFFSFFLPKGSPLFLAPLLILLEIVSYTFRVLSLAIRLFANMMAGHTLLAIFVMFVDKMLKAGGFLIVAALVPFIIVCLLTGLEVVIAFLQAYVFTILICLYLNDAIHLH
jgi:ATP synthase subunit 6